MNMRKEMCIYHKEFQETAMMSFLYKESITIIVMEK